MKRIGWIVLGVAMALMQLGCSGGDKPITYPANQKAFYALNKQCQQQYAGGQNEIQKSLSFNQCNRQRLDFSRSEKISGWVGEITSISTDQGADVVSVTIEASIDGFDATFSTLGNRVSDYATDSLITQSNPLFNVLAQMKEGELVAFDASFLPHPEGERGIWESSLTEQGSMDAPSFKVKFTDIRPYSERTKDASPAPTASSRNSVESKPIEEEALAQGGVEDRSVPTRGSDFKGGKFLYRELIDGGPYWNDWYATTDVAAQPRDGYVSLNIVADGKLPFTGSVVLNCADGRQSWNKASAYGEAVADQDIEKTVPDEVVSSALTVFCSGESDEQFDALMEAADATIAEINEASHPSFDCGKAAQESERAICSNSTLGKTDKYTADMYRCLLERSSADKETLQAEQREWLPKRNECKDDVGCLRGAYGDIAEVYMKNSAFNECQSMVAGE